MKWKKHINEFGSLALSIVPAVIAYRANHSLEYCKPKTMLVGITFAVLSFMLGIEAEKKEGFAFIYIPAMLISAVSGIICGMVYIACMMICPFSVMW
ncbi:MAG: hypothetical protein IJZ72_09375 [Oscillospiraceae bacterium]|nr:hypothetical protein [Oscillospiraceae bacterium]